MADDGHTKGLGSTQGPISWLMPPPMASSKVMNLGWSNMHPTPPLPTHPLPELVLIDTHVSYQCARVLMEADGREGECEGDHSDSQSNWLLMDAGEWRPKGAQLTPFVPCSVLKFPLYGLLLYFSRCFRVFSCKTPENWELGSDYIMYVRDGWVILALSSNFPLQLILIFHEKPAACHH